MAAACAASIPSSRPYPPRSAASVEDSPALRRSYPPQSADPPSCLGLQYGCAKPECVPHLASSDPGVRRKASHSASRYRFQTRPVQPAPPESPAASTRTAVFRPNLPAQPSTRSSCSLQEIPCALKPTTPSRCVPTLAAATVVGTPALLPSRQRNSFETAPATPHR